MNRRLGLVLVVKCTVILALLGNVLLSSPSPAQAAALLPDMTVTLSSGNSAYSTTAYVGTALIFRATVKNTGNIPLQVTANLTVPAGWDVDQEAYNDCPEALPVRHSCTISWYFTPQATGQVYLRVYLRGNYTDSAGAAARITRSPAFIFNVKPAKGSSGSSGSGSSSTPVPSVGNSPSMTVGLFSGNSIYSSTVYADKPLILRATVKNTGNVPLQVTANLTVPTGWEVDQEMYSDCPEDLASKATCTISWYFTPQATGQVWLRVYVRGNYTTSAGVAGRVTQSPAFIFNVKPPKTSQ